MNEHENNDNTNEYGRKCTELNKTKVFIKTPE